MVMFDLRNVPSEEVLLEDINNRVNLLLKAVRKYVAYKIFTAKEDTTCGELATETNDIHELLKALTEYTEREKMKQGMFKMLHEEAAKLMEDDNE